jgi:(4S)-4-hydroxy-5-phosphonooxypentane-2,3-dione isomerase
MLVLIVNIKVKPDRIEAFRAATLENARESLKEPGIGRFDLLQDTADPSRFVLIEGYADAAAQAAHKETAHYAKWKDLAEPMMAEPRTRATYSTLGPEGLAGR